MRLIQTSLASLVLGMLAASAIGQCSSVQFYVPAQNTDRNPHNALQVTDPSGQQVATFDLYWGGMLVSLKYQGVEYIDQSNLATGSGVQTALHYGSPDYNPTQAGANPYWPSEVLGASCNSSGQVNLWSSMPDYNRNLSGRSPAYTVFNGALNLSAFFTPYVINTFSSWVPNPAGNPSYYLKLPQIVTEVGSEDRYWGWDLAFYASRSPDPLNLTVLKQSPSNCTVSTPCSSQTQLPLVGGLYTDSTGTTGVATGVGAGSTLTTGSSQTWFVYGSGSQVGSIHLQFGNEHLAQGAPKVYNWYIMVGSWANALAFMQTHN